MKWSVKFIISLTAIMFVLISCDFIRDIFPNGKSKITFRASTTSKTNQADTVLFTGDDIKWLKGTTGEVCFVDSLTIPKAFSFHRIKCYLGTDSLFTASMTSDYMSSILNDLVLNHNLQDGKYYFSDGYPDYIENVGAKNVRIQNKEKRAVAWTRFTDELKKEGRYVIK